MIARTRHLLALPALLLAMLPASSRTSSISHAAPLRPAAVGASNAVFTVHPTTPSFGAGASFDVALGDLDGDGDLDARFANGGSEAEPVWLNQQPLTVTAVAPPANGLDVAVDIPISATLSASIDQSSVTSTTLRVWGEQTGLYAGGVTFPATDTLQRGHALPFKPGETITVQATSGIHGSGGVVLAPYGWQFRAAATSASAVFAPHPTTPAFGGSFSFDLALGDLDGDGDLDAVVANDNADVDTVWRNDGSGGFAELYSFGGQGSQEVVLGDLDGDGDLDAVFANNGVQAETVWRNDGAGFFTAHPTTPSFGAGSDSRGVALGDLDGDGDLDAVVANANAEAETVWLNDGAGAFTAHPATPAFGSRSSMGVALGDLDGDGDLDAVVANAFTDQEETVWLNDGSGGFVAHPTTPIVGIGDSFDVALGDLDGDGDLDALFANGNGQEETVWLNDGSGAFVSHPTAPGFGAGDSRGVALGDLDGDGDLDAMLASDGGQEETVWLNQPLSAVYLPLVPLTTVEPIVTLEDTDIPERDVNQQGEVFYQTTIALPQGLPAGGTFYLSSKPTEPVAALVDDQVLLRELAADGGDLIFSYNYSTSGTPRPALVEVPRSALAPYLGQTIRLQFKDLYGASVGATPVYLIWVG